MGTRLRFLPAGSTGLLVELDGLEQTLALFDALTGAALAGVTELVPAARTVLVSYDPLQTTRERLTAAIAGLDLSEKRERQGESLTIPVLYDGEDLADVADMLGLSVEALIRRHGAATFTVAFTGFAPGFAYMTPDDPGLSAPRRKSPRLRIPAGSVAMAGAFGGIYPSDSPGGWQLLGRTPLAMWDLARPQAALLKPGDRVRFTAIAEMPVPPVTADIPSTPTETDAARGLVVLRTDRPLLFQDAGRPGQAGQGISASGALDRTGLAEANLAAGNPRHAPALEIALGGVTLEAREPLTLALSGAPAPLTIRTPEGRAISALPGKPFALDAGDRLEIGYPSRGMRSYLALRGGFAVDPVLGSAATDTLAKVGPPPVTSGAVLQPAGNPALAVDPDRPAEADLPEAGATVTLDILPGPRTDWFTPESVEHFLAASWDVTGQSDRVGMRLQGAEPLERRDPAAELPSEATPLGALQVPHSGQPVLFLADHPLTGGYPVIAVVAAHHLDLAGQIPIGARLRFRAIAAFDPLVRETVR